MLFNLNVFAPTGHNVEEIRVRALRNILFKLDHKLVCAADLVHERQLLINLLEWFNFPNPPLKKEVLEILEVLSKVSVQCTICFGLNLFKLV